LKNDEIPGNLTNTIIEIEEFDFMGVRIRLRM